MPIRKNRGKKIELDKDRFEPKDPQIAAWRLLKRDKWTINRKMRNLGLEYALEKLMCEGMTE